MSERTRPARIAAAVLSTAAVLAAAALPGAATAASDGDPTAYVTRAVLLQGDAGADISRSTLITQVQADGQGDISFEVPVADGSTPSNMDSFGSPTIVDGAAVYDLSVDGPQTTRTSQPFDAADVPVRLRVEAKLDGRSIPVTDLHGVTGEVELTYTASNLTGTDTQLEFPDASGATVTEEVELPTAMGGTLDIQFPPSWTEVSSPDATVLSGDGAGRTTFSAGYTLFEPFGEPTQTVTITAQATDADLPPVEARFTILRPEQNPTARSLSEQLATGAESGATIYAGGAKLEEGTVQLSTGLTAAAAGAVEIANGVNNTLVPGVNQLNDGVQNELRPGVRELVSALEDLPGTVAGSADFQQLTGAFASLDASVAGVRDALGVFSSTGAGQYLTAAGDVDKARTTVARTIWALIYGVRAADVPSGSAGRTPAEATGGLTNPSCSPAAPTDPANPCGAWQVVQLVKGGMGQVSAGLGTAQGVLDQQINPGIQQVQDGLTGAKTVIDTQINPGVGQIAGGLAQAEDVLTTQGAAAWGQLAALLGCQVAPAGSLNGSTGPIVIACPNTISTVAGDVQGDVGALLQGMSGGLYAGANADPTRSGLAALLGQFAGPRGLGAVGAGLTQISDGLELAIPGLGQASGGLTQISGGLTLAMGALNQQLTPALTGLQESVTSRPDGTPDPNTANGTTATGTLNQLRGALALGGAGDSGVPGKCEGYNTPGSPGSGLNTAATPQRIGATCAAADVLNIASLISGALQAGISGDLLNGISDQLVAGVSPLVSGVDGLAAGTQRLADGVGPLATGTLQLADGLPAAVDGVERIRTDAAIPLQEQGNDAALSYGRSVALYAAMNDQELVDAYIPAGPASGGDVRTSGAFVFELAGVGSGGTSTGANFALGLLGLIAAGGAGYFLARRRQGA